MLFIIFISVLQCSVTLQQLFFIYKHLLYVTKPHSLLQTCFTYQPVHSLKSQVKISDISPRYLQFLPCDITLPEIARRSKLASRERRLDACITCLGALSPSKKKRGSFI